MTSYHEVFLPIFFCGCLFAAVTSFLAGRLRGCVLPGFLLANGVLGFWAALFFGSVFGYRAWQLTDHPPDEAFSDASALAALFLGWFPGILFCVAVFTFVRSIRWMIGWTHLHPFPPELKRSAAPLIADDTNQEPHKDATPFNERLESSTD